jgi:hypothetical protein
MKNQQQSLLKDSMSEVRAKRAVRRLQKWMESQYPQITSALRSKLIIECLVEIAEERRFLAQQ